MSPPAATGLPVRTIRFWSDEVALPPVARSESGYRLYDAESLARLELIRTLRKLGLSLDDVRKVLGGETDIAPWPLPRGSSGRADPLPAAEPHSPVDRRETELDH